MRQPDEKRPFIPHASQQFRITGNFDENVLKQVARVGLVTDEIQEKSVKRLGVLVVEPAEVGAAHGSSI